MTNSEDPDQLASEEPKLIWIYTICKVRAYRGSAGQGLSDRKELSDRVKW